MKIVHLTWNLEASSMHISQIVSSLHLQQHWSNFENCIIWSCIDFFSKCILKNESDRWAFYTVGNISFQKWNVMLVLKNWNSALSCLHTKKIQPKTFFWFSNQRRIQARRNWVIIGKILILQFKFAATFETDFPTVSVASFLDVRPTKCTSWTKYA